MMGAVASYRDGEFNLSLAVKSRDELGELTAAHNALGHALRTERSNLAQRELFLDMVMQRSPVALVLADSHQRVAYANLAARHLLNEGRSMDGLDFSAVLVRSPSRYGWPSSPTPIPSSAPRSKGSRRSSRSLSGCFSCKAGRIVSTCSTR